jgi:hypothetical protein
MYCTYDVNTFCKARVDAISGYPFAEHVSFCGAYERVSCVWIKRRSSFFATLVQIYYIIQTCTN